LARNALREDGFEKPYQQMAQVIDEMNLMLFCGFQKKQISGKEIQAFFMLIRTLCLFQV